MKAFTLGCFGLATMIALLYASALFIPPDVFEDHDIVITAVMMVIMLVIMLGINMILSKLVKKTKKQEYYIPKYNCKKGEVFHFNNIQECVPSPSPSRDPLVDRLNEFERAVQSSPELVAERPIFPDDSFCPYCKDKMERRESGGIVVASCRLCKRSFSNVGPVFIDGKIQIIKYADASLKEMIPVPLE